MIETIGRDEHNRRTVFQFTSVCAPRIERKSAYVQKSQPVLPSIPCPFVEKGEHTCQVSMQTVH